MSSLAVVFALMEVLFGGGGAERDGEPTKVPPVIIGRIVNVLETGARAQIWVDKGDEDGVAIGDRARLPCRDDVGVVGKLVGRRAVIDIATGAWPASREVHVGRGGLVPQAWCDEGR